MRILVDDVLLFELSETQKKVICDNVNEDIFDEDMKRRLQYILMHKYEECMKELRKKWSPVLVEEGALSITTDNDEFAQLIFDRPDYKSRKQRDEEVVLP